MHKVPNLGDKQRRFLVFICGRPQAGLVDLTKMRKADRVVYRALAAKGLVTAGDKLAYVTPYGRYVNLFPHERLLVRVVLRGGLEIRALEDRQHVHRLKADAYVTVASEGGVGVPLTVRATLKGCAFVDALGEVAIDDRVMVECSHCGGEGKEQAECSGCGVALTYANQSFHDPEGCCKVCAKKDGCR